MPRGGRSAYSKGGAAVRRAEAMTDLPFLNAMLYTALGVTAFVVAFAIVVKLAPVQLWKQLVEERNIAVAIVAGAVALGLCWIIAATMH